MLDEVRELELYAFDPDDDASFPKGCRMLRPFKKGKKNDLACVPRALEVVARQCLFHDNASAEEAAGRAEEAKALLRQWCGFAGDAPDDVRIPGLENHHDWMKRYIEAYCRLTPGCEARPLMVAWNAHKKGYESGAFTKQRLTASDVNDVSYEVAIARALRKGPLKRRAMVGKLVPGDTCTTDSLTEDGSFAKLNASNDSTVILLTGMCLRGLGADGGVPESDFTPINMQELCGWLGRGKEFDRKVLESWLYDGEQLFVQDSERSGVKSWKVGQAWLDDGQWQLIDITEGDEPLRDFCRKHEGEGFRCYLDADYVDPSFEMGPLKSLVSYGSAEFAE